MPRATPQAAPPELTVEARYYDYQWNEVNDRSRAAFAVRVLKDPSGRIVRREHESYKPYPTRSTDPKTGSHQH